jgi:Vacuolar sorting protein 9 (VPS9) domain
LTSKPFERTIAALKEIPEVNAPMSKLEYIYQVFNNLMITEIDEFWKPAGDKVDSSQLEIDYENLNGIAIYVALKANLPILIVDILFIENFVSQAILTTNRAYQMTVLHSALAFIEENLPSYFESKDKLNPLKEQQFTPKFRTSTQTQLHHNHHSSSTSHNNKESIPLEVENSITSDPTKQQPPMKDH